MTDLLKASEQFIDVTLVICFIAVSMSLVLLTYGVIKGPTNADRAVALDAIGINLMAIAALTAIFLVTSRLNDVILLIGIISFLSTVTIAKYIEKGVIIDRDMDCHHLKQSYCSLFVNRNIFYHLEYNWNYHLPRCIYEITCRSNSSDIRYCNYLIRLVFITV